MDGRSPTYLAEALYTVSQLNSTQQETTDAGVYISIAPHLFLPRDALLSAVYAVVVCLCVCVSVTLRYCIKTAKRK